jgi:hypothetical protein
MHGAHVDNLCRVIAQESSRMKLIELLRTAKVAEGGIAVLLSSCVAEEDIAKSCPCAEPSSWIMKNSSMLHGRC